jgi:NAD(P)-dependent dehydrogenase (short-subunit alcohol dehydrogenase family)
MQLENKVAIVTGGAGGIGQGIVRNFLDEGAKVIIVDIVEQTKGDELIANLDCGDDAQYLKSDISVPDNAATIISYSVKTFGKLDILVNNAHASKQAPFTETTQEMWDLSLRSGMFGTFWLMQASHPELKKTKGAIVNFASGAGLSGQANMVTYAAAKEAIRAITRVAANEWAADGVRVNLVSPVAKTPAVQKWANAYPAEYKAFVEAVPLGRLGDPETDIAPAVTFLASNAARYITGQTLMTDGGLIMLH